MHDGGSDTNSHFYVNTVLLSLDTLANGTPIKDTKASWKTYSFVATGSFFLYTYQ